MSKATRMLISNDFKNEFFEQVEEIFRESNINSVRQEVKKLHEKTLLEAERIDSVLLSIYFSIDKLSIKRSDLVTLKANLKYIKSDAFEKKINRYYEIINITFNSIDSVNNFIEKAHYNVNKEIEKLNQHDKKIILTAKFGSNSKAINRIFLELTKRPYNLKHGLIPSLLELKTLITKTVLKFIGNIDEIKSFILININDLTFSRRQLTQEIGINIFDNSKWNKYILNSLAHADLIDTLSIDWQSKKIKESCSGAAQAYDDYIKLVTYFSDCIIQENIKATSKEIEFADGQEFEVIIKKELESYPNINVELTKSTGDFGADLIIKYGNFRVIAQLKKYQGSVGVSAVQEVFSAVNFYNGTHGIVITTGKYTKSAIKLASSNGVILSDYINYRNVICQILGIA